MVVQSWNVLVIVLLAVLGYFFGNIQTALIISRLVFGDDVRKYGSGNAGSTNMIRVYGKKFGFMTLAGDAGKAAIAFLIGRQLGRLLGLNVDDPALAAGYGGCIALLASVIGHCYPVLYHFKGGKGAASCFALMYCFCWQAALVSTVAIVLIFLWTRRVSLVSMGTAVLFVLLTGLCVLLGWTDAYYFWFAVPAASLLIFRHIPNIKRLIKGEEPKLHLIHGKPLKDTETGTKEES